MTTTDATQTPSTWRTTDGTEVTLEEATTAWAVEAREVLIEVAKHYHTYITYADLAEQVQTRTGIQTRSQTRNWISGVLGQVSDGCHALEEPNLAALCVQTDESVGAAYDYALTLTGEERPEDVEVHAAETRLACYRYFGAADLPKTGGYAAMTTKVASARQRARNKFDPVVHLCPSCFTQLPSSGQCDNCT